MMRANQSVLLAVLLAAVLSCLSGCGTFYCDDKPLVGLSDLADAKPKVEVFYPVAVPEKTVQDNSWHDIETTGTCVTYFTVRVPYLSRDWDPGSKQHGVLHYVIGGYGPDGTKGRVRINGVQTDANGKPTFKPRDGVALISVEEGWVWVSDDPPCASGLFSAAMAASGPDDTSDQPESDDQPTTASVSIWGGWSILTLLKAEWTWAGSIGTEFIYRVESPNAPNAGKVHRVYGLSSSGAQFSWRPILGSPPHRYRVKEGRFRKSTDFGIPSGSKPIQSDTAEKMFRDHVKSQLELIKSGATPNCDQAAQAD